MSTNTLRGDRRHHEKRIYARRLREMRPWIRRSTIPFQVWRHVDKAPNKVCSCEMCGNPRRHFGDVTWQEIVADAPAIPEREQGDWMLDDDEPAWWGDEYDDCSWDAEDVTDSRVKMPLSERARIR